MMETNERLVRLEANESNIFHQLSEIKDDVRDIRRLISAVETIAVKTESIDLKVDDMGSRLSKLETEPSESFRHYKRLIIGTMATAAITAVISAIFALVIR